MTYGGAGQITKMKRAMRAEIQKVAKNQPPSGKGL